MISLRGSAARGRCLCVARFADALLCRPAKQAIASRKCQRDLIPPASSLTLDRCAWAVSPPCKTGSSSF